MAALTVKTEPFPCYLGINTSDYRQHILQNGPTHLAHRGMFWSVQGAGVVATDTDLDATI